MWQANPISGGRDLHVRHGTAGVRGAARRRGGRLATRGANAVAGNGNHRISRRRFAGGGVLFSHPAAGPPPVGWQPDKAAGRQPLATRSRLGASTISPRAQPCRQVDCAARVVGGAEASSRLCRAMPFRGSVVRRPPTAPPTSSTSDAVSHRQSSLRHARSLARTTRKQSRCSSGNPPTRRVHRICR